MSPMDVAVGIRQQDAADPGNRAAAKGTRDVSENVTEVSNSAVKTGRSPPLFWRLLPNWLSNPSVAAGSRALPRTASRCFVATCWPIDRRLPAQMVAIPEPG